MNKVIRLPEVSAKSTKDQLLAVYNQAVKLVASKQEDSSTHTAIKTQKATIVAEAVKIAKMLILDELGCFENKLSKEIEAITETIDKELQTLTTVRDAIKIEQKMLKELYQINPLIRWQPYSKPKKTKMNNLLR